MKSLPTSKIRSSGKRAEAAKGSTQQPLRPIRRRLCGVQRLRSIERSALAANDSLCEGPQAYIESSADGTTFLSWKDASKALGPATPLTERELTYLGWGESNGPFEGEAGAPIDVTTASGASFAGTIGLGSEKNSNTCWYWFHGTIIS